MPKDRRKSRNGITKREAQVEHARKRARQRFDLELNRSARKHILGQVQSGKSIIVERKSLRVSIRLVQLPTGEYAKIVYDHNRHVIVTLMKPSNQDLTVLEKIKTRER